MKNLFKRLWKDESAISATEYGIIAAVLGAGLYVVLRTFGGQITNLFTNAGNSINNTQ